LQCLHILIYRYYNYLQNYILEMGKISHDVKVLVIAYLKDGASQRQVSQKLGIAKTTVQNIWDKFSKGMGLENRVSPGRPRKLSRRDERKLVITSKRNPFLTPKELAESMPNAANVSISTVRRYLRRNLLFARVAARKLMISPENKRKRLAWCKAYKTWDVNSWKNVIFSDESLFEQYSRRRILVRRRIGQRNLNTFVTKTVANGGFRLMVWGAIKGDGTKMLFRCPSILNSETYQNVLHTALLPQLNSNSIFMQDGAPCHRSRSTLTFLENHGVCLLSDWPAQSPDLNIIENLWATLKKNVSRRHPKNKEDLWAILQEEWSKVDSSEVRNLYDSVPRRLQVVIKEKGFPSKY